MSVISFKCPNCDGELIFDPDSQKYKCEYCGAEFSQEELDALEPAQGEERQAEAGPETGTETEQNSGEEKQADDKEQQADENVVVYTCPSCGAEIVTDATTAATFCYYCHNPVVLLGRVSGEYLPEKIIPFAINKEKAVAEFLAYVGKKKFVPKDFFNKKQIETMTGVYFPFWMLDCDLTGTMDAEATKVRTWIAGKEEFTETRFYHVVREGSVSINDLTKNALKKANHVLVEGVLPYRFDEMKDFNMGYLSGFLAEKRDIEQTEIEVTMMGEMQQYAGNLMRETVQGYSHVKVNGTNLVPAKKDFDYVLLPLWTITYKGKDGKVYYYSMNGQTGKICGELPVDKVKITFTGILVAVIVLAIVLLGGILL